METYPTTISVGVAANERIMVVPPPPTAMPESVAPRFTTRPGINMSLFRQERRLYMKLLVPPNAQTTSQLFEFVSLSHPESSSEMMKTEMRPLLKARARYPTLSSSDIPTTALSSR